MAKILVTTDAGEVMHVMEGADVERLRFGLEHSPMTHGEDSLAFAIYFATMEDDVAKREAENQYAIFVGVR